VTLGADASTTYLRVDYVAPYVEPTLRLHHHGLQPVVREKNLGARFGSGYEGRVEVNLCAYAPSQVGRPHQARCHIERWSTKFAHGPTWCLGQEIVPTGMLETRRAVEGRGYLDQLGPHPPYFWVLGLRE
jgi:hypothetical protein